MPEPSTGRRRFLKSVGSVAAIGAAAGCLGGGGESGGSGEVPGDSVEPASKIQFISESTGPSKALKQISSEFTDETGIEVEFTLTPLLNYTEKLANDLTSEAGNYDAVYVDPYNIGAPYYGQLEPLDAYVDEFGYDMDDHYDIHVNACSTFADGKYRALPYDCPTIMWAYRRDVFEQYHDQATSDLGFEFMPGPERTWSEYMEMSKWMNENVDEVTAGTGHMAKQHQSLANEFEMILWAHGGGPFKGYEGKDPALPDPLEPGFTSEAGIEAASFYQELVSDVAHPGSTTWDWTGVAQAFANGEIAMLPEWHEFNGMFANPDSSEVADVVEWTIAPQGPKHRINHYGGSGIGINTFISEEKKLAAWKFIEWTTSAETQFKLLEASGGTPTRESVYEREEVQEAKELSTSESPYPNIVPPVEEAWAQENVGQRPHHPQWLELEQVIYTEGSKMVNGSKSPQDTMQACHDQFQEILDQ